MDAMNYKIPNNICQNADVDYAFLCWGRSLFLGAPSARMFHRTVGHQLLHAIHIEP